VQDTIRKSCISSSSWGIIVSVDVIGITGQMLVYDEVNAQSSSEESKGSREKNQNISFT